MSAKTTPSFGGGGGSHASSAAQRTGAFPVYQAAQDFSFSEFIANGSNGNPRAQIVTVKVPPTMTQRKLYVYLVSLQYQANKDTAAYFSVELFNNLTSVGKLRCDHGYIANQTTIGQSLPSVATFMANPTALCEDMLRVDLCAPISSASEPKTVHLTPWKFTAQIDTVAVNFERAINIIECYRAFLAVASSL